MNSNFEELKSSLYDETYEYFNMGDYIDSKRNNTIYEPDIDKEYVERFMTIIDNVSLSLISSGDNYYGYFFLKCLREIKFSIETPTAISFKNGKFIIYFNPILYLQLDINQMKSCICHEILHIVSHHMIRKDELRKKGISSLACNMAMDIVVNQYLDNLPPYAITINKISLKYGVNLEPYETLEYYASIIQDNLNLLDEDKHGEEDDSKGEINQTEKNIGEKDSNDDLNFNIENCHDSWEDGKIDEKTLSDFIKKYSSSSAKGTVPKNIEEIVSRVEGDNSEISWEMYLKRLVGKVQNGKKKISTRRDRRQPYRLDLRGQLNRYKPEIAVAFDISGSISDEEFKYAVKEVLAIVKNYNHKITIIECDEDIKQIYTVKSERDIKNRSAIGGGTRFSPVFEYVKRKNFDLLIYFTDGKGESKLTTIPNGYKVLWVICGDEDLSLSNPYGIVKHIKRIEDKDKYIEIKDLKTDGYSMNSQQPIL